MDAITQFSEAVVAFDEKNVEMALEKLRTIPQPSAVIHYNIGVLHWLQTGHAQAVKSFTSALEKDKHLSVAYFQRGCVHFEQKQYDKALSDFESCRHLFRNRKAIDYTILGLHCKLNVCEVIYNMGLASGMGSNLGRGVQLILEAQENKQRKQHAVIDQTVATLERYCQFSEFSLIRIPTDIFRPTRTPTTNVCQDFLGQSKVIVSQEAKSTMPTPQVELGASGVDCSPMPPPPSNPPPRKPASSSPPPVSSSNRETRKPGSPFNPQPRKPASSPNPLPLKPASPNPPPRKPGSSPNPPPPNIPPPRLK